MVKVKSGHKRNHAGRIVVVQNSTHKTRTEQMKREVAVWDRYLIQMWS